MKKKILLIALVLFAFVSTIGVGFASWVISRPANETKEGEFYVETVTDESMHLVVSFDNSSKNYLSFYGPENAGNQGDKWFTFGLTEENNADVTKYANLGVVIKVQVQKMVNSQPVDVQGAYEVHFVFSEGSVSNNEFTASAASAAVSLAGDNDDLLSGATFRSAFAADAQSPSAITPTQDNGGAPVWEFTVITDTNGVAYLFIDYAWGTHFDYSTGEAPSVVNHTNVNPFEFYNHVEADTEYAQGVSYADDAMTQMTAIYNQVNGLSFQLKVKVSATDAQ